MEIFLIYLWGIYPQVGSVVVALLSISAVYFFGVLVTYPVNILADDKPPTIPYIRSTIAASVTLLLLYTLTPSRNVAVMMVSAPTIVSLAHTAADSNATAQIGTILQNSLNYLEKASANLEVPK